MAAVLRSIASHCKQYHSVRRALQPPKKVAPAALELVSEALAFIESGLESSRLTQRRIAGRVWSDPGRFDATALHALRFDDLSRLCYGR